MDDRPLTEPPAPRSSAQKIEDVLEQLRSTPPDSEQSARMLQVLGMVLPMVRRIGAIPDDPAELDEMLLKGATVALRLRSDWAALPASIDELLNPEPVIEAEAEEITG